MNINRNNYEELFLLYLDNELTASERSAVEKFVSEHDDLAKEFYALQQTVLLPTDDEFLHKSNLYKTSGGITTTNCEEFFLLHLDNELNEEDKDAVEKFVLQHPESQTNFSLLHQTKLEAETLVFENKHLLYKQPAGKVYFIKWSRYAVAALLAGVAVALYFMLDNPLTPDNELITKSSYSSKKPALPLNNAQLTKLPVENAGTNLSKDDKKIMVAKTVPLKQNKQQNDFKSFEVKREMNVITPQVATIIKTEQKLIEQEEQKGNLANKDLATAISPELTGNTFTTATQQNTLQEPDIAKQAVYQEIDTETDDRENSVLFGSTRINKNKLRGLLKKASGLFDKKADKADTDKTIHIASFEIKGK